MKHNFLNVFDKILQLSHLCAMGTLILFFSVSITFSFLCSVWEAVLLSVTPSYVRRAQQDRPALGHQLSVFKKDVDRPLSAILTLNTIAHTVGAIGVGAQAGKLFGSTELSFLGLSISLESIIAGAMTLAILVFSEIIPKTIGANLWEELVPFTMKALGVLLWVLAPFVWLSQFITKRIKKDKDRSVLSRTDLSIMANMGEESGVIAKSESEVITNILKLEEITVHDIMTPRTVIFMLDEKMTLKEFYTNHKNVAFSRIPIYGKGEDDITGFVLKDEILECLIEGEGEKMLLDLKREITFVMDSAQVSIVFNSLLKNKEHVVMAVNEHGTLVGIMSLEDIFETIIGLEIVDETDTIEDLQKHAVNKYKKQESDRGVID